MPTLRRGSGRESALGTVAFWETVPVRCIVQVVVKKNRICVASGAGWFVEFSWRRCRAISTCILDVGYL